MRRHVHADAVPTDSFNPLIDTTVTLTATPVLEVVSTPLAGTLMFSGTVPVEDAGRQQPFCGSPGIGYSQ